MGEIVSFNKKSNKIDYDKYLTEDSYLRTTALNGLKSCGYHLNRNGVLQFQHDNKLKETGVLSIDDLPVLVLSFDPQTRQDFINYLEKIKMDKKEDKNKKDKSILAIITLSLILIFELYGIVSCFFDIVNSIMK